MGIHKFDEVATGALFSGSAVGRQFCATARLVTAAGINLSQSGLDSNHSHQCDGLQAVKETIQVGDVACATWDKLWPTEKRKQVGLHKSVGDRGL